MDKHRELKKEIAYFMSRLYRQRLTTTSGGNISVRAGDGAILITPSASDKGRMKWTEIGEISIESMSNSSNFRPSIESQLHLAIYRRRPDVKAIIHAHPITCSAFAAGKGIINTHLLSESYAILGEISYSAYFCMGTTELADQVGRQAASSDCIIMRNHGALTVGNSLLQAFDRIEVLEATAKITLITDCFFRGQTTELDREELQAIDTIMNR